jgi:hypothetical protein
MMRSKLALPAVAFLLLVGNNGTGPAVVIQPLMKDIVAPQAQILWDVGNKGMDDDGNPSAKAITAQDWQQLGGAARAMKAAMTSLIDARQISVTPGNARLPDEGTPGVSSTRDIQGFIDQEPAAFSQYARELADVSDGFIQAATAKDAVKLADASSRMDGVCEGCHVKFWYPKEDRGQSK